MESNTKGVLEIIIAEFLVSLNYILARFGKEMGNYFLAFSRVFLSFLFTGILFLFSKKYKLVPFKYEKGKLIFFGAIHGLIVLAAFISINFLSIASSVLLQATISIWVAVFSVFILNEKLRLRAVIFLGMAFLGVILILKPETFFIEESLIGSAAGLFVGLFGGLVYVLSKTFRKYDKISLSFWQNLIAVPFLIPLLFLQKPIFSFSSSFIVVGIGFFGAVSFIFLYSGLGRIKGQNASVLTLLYVVFSIILALILFGEVPTFREVIGGILIIISACFINTQ